MTPTPASKKDRATPPRADAGPPAVLLRGDGLSPQARAWLPWLRALLTRGERATSGGGGERD